MAMRLSWQFRNESVAKLSKALLESFGAISRPVCTVTSRNSLAARKGNIQYVVVSVTTVSVQSFVGEAKLAKRKRRFTG
jgi:hypothetical protein